MRRASHSTETYRASLTKMHELDDALELMYFGWRGVTLAADEYLATLGLSRPHHRILYVIARRPGISVGALIEVLGISKQALNRPLNLLFRRDLVTSERSPEQHRSKLLRLTEEGKRIEHRASSHERRVMKKAFESVGASGADAWMAVMKTIADSI
jgi:DNA-binding MarR family transcriptional regulator